MVMEDLQHILPEKVTRHFNNGRTMQIILISIIGVLLLLTITFASLFATKHVELNNMNAANGAGSASALSGGGGTCMTSKCLEAAAWMVKNVDSSVKPCDDFYAYACGRFIQRTEVPPDSGYTSVKYNMWDRNERKLRKVVESEIERNGTNSAERKLKEFFLSCLHDYGRYKEGGLVLVDIIKNHLGGWYAFNPTNFSSTWDMTQAMTSAITEYLVEVLFAIDVYPDLRNMKKNVINIRRGGLGMYYSYYYRDDKVHLETAYKNYISHVAYLLSYDGNTTINSEVVDQFVEDVWYQENMIAQAMQERRRQSNWWSSAFMTISQLQSNVSQISWLPIFRGMFGQDVSDSTEIYVRQLGYFEFINELLTNETTNKTRIMNNYITWRVIDNYANHLSWDYKYAGFIFHEKYTGSDLYLPTWEHCLNTVEYRLGPALATEFLHKHVGESGKKTGEQIVSEMKSTLNDTIGQIAWMDEETKGRAREKLSHVDSLVGFPGEYFNSTYIDELHSSLYINMTDGYFMNLLRINNFTKTMLKKELNMGRHYNMWRYLMSGGTFGVSPVFYMTMQTLIVPGGAMMDPQFYTGSPGYISYAAIGSLIAEQFANSINLRGRYIWHNSSYTNWWSRTTLANYTSVSDCMRESIEGTVAGPYLIDGENVTVPLRPYGSSAVISDIMGLKTAYKTYLKHVNGIQRLPGLNLTTHQAFFLSATQMKCSKWSPYEAYSHARAGYLPDNIMMNTVLGHMPEFSEAFNCPKQAPMNPEDKCHVF